MKILNFGSLNLDFTYQVDHLVLPGETIASDSFKINLGGKGLNQSIALAHAGAEVYHAGKIGKDGTALRAFLERNNVNTGFIANSESSTGHAIIQVDASGQNSIILYSGANRTMTFEFIHSIISEFEQGDVLLLQNEVNALNIIMEEAHKKGMKIALNPSPCDDSILKLPLHYVKWFFINEIEGWMLTGKHSPEDIVSEMLSRYPNSVIILTLGEKGVLYGDKLNRYVHPAYNVCAADTTGAGDTFTGYFLSGLLNNQSIPIALKYASAAAAIAVSSKGAAEAIPRLQQVQEFLSMRENK